MDYDAYVKTDELEHRYWWYVGRRYVFDKILSRYFHAGKQAAIADIGCGTGGNLSTLQKHGNVLGLDISQQALDYCKSKGFTNVHLMPSDTPNTGLGDNCVNLITMFDVLEHISDDSSALREYYRILKPGGMLFLTVPAFKFLWSELDDHVHHIRRYTKPKLENLLTEAGFELVKSSYLFFLTFPLVFLYRVVGKFQEKKLHPQFSYVELPKIVNDVLITFSKIEAFLLKFFNLPIGSSVICLARKKV